MTVFPFRVVLSNTRTRCNHCASKKRYRLKDFQITGVDRRDFEGKLNAL
jgi:hypothetical protein